MENDTQAPTSAVPSAEDTSAIVDQGTASSQVDTAPDAGQIKEETSDLTAADTVEEKLYAGKYKTVEELESAYKSAESKIGSVTSEKAELSRILSEAFVSDTPVAQPQVPDYDDLPEEPTSSPANDTVTKKLAIMEFAMNHPDANGDAMDQILKNDPDVAHISSYEGKLKYAYALSKATVNTKAVEAARKQAEVDTKMKIAEKQAAQVESVTKQSPAPDSSQPLTPHEIRSTLNDPKAMDELIKKQFPGIGRMMS